MELIRIELTTSAVRLRGIVFLGYFGAFWVIVNTHNFPIFSIAVFFAPYLFILF